MISWIKGTQEYYFNGWAPSPLFRQLGIWILSRELGLGLLDL
jgi:hypothetical protein